MKVSTSIPFQIVYSIYNHEYLGYLVESFIVRKNDKGKLTLQNQNISYANAFEFASGLDETDFKLIKLMDRIQQETIINKFSKIRVKPAIFFNKVYKSENPDKLLQTAIQDYIEDKKSDIFSMMKGKELYEMGADGDPAWNKIEILDKKATVLFHFMRNEENTHYFPTIQYNKEKVDFQYRGAYIVCRKPAWMVLNNKLYSFEKDLDGAKLNPFLNKKFISVPRKMEETYYRRFVASIISSFNVHSKGFQILEPKYEPVPVLRFSELKFSQEELFENSFNGNGMNDDESILFDLRFQYGPFLFKAKELKSVSVELEHDGSDFTFHKVKRNTTKELDYLDQLRKLGIELKNGETTLPKLKAFDWINKHKSTLEEVNFIISQKKIDGKKFFLGNSSIAIQISENIDWFDIYAKVRFGDHEIPFNELRRIILLKKNEITLPNGDIAVIPESWLIEYSELFAFMDDKKDHTDVNAMRLKKHHLALVKDLENGRLAQVSMSRKLERLRNFEEIDECPIPLKFIGELRPYQKAGFNWLQFLKKYNFGGCLADDMGLGKTVQTLAMLQSQKGINESLATLLVMPTSLIYNWELEAQKFTPELKILAYTGTNRNKDVSEFSKFDLILTSYGIVRLDIDLLIQYYFHYIILDESQSIKNPNSNISKAVRKLKSRFRLILTGTPLENSTLDLWSQMTFINPGLLGNQSFFRNEFLKPIEKNKDEYKTQKLNSIIKPFILRRHKSQVATELPEKVENVKYCSMTAMQEEYYEETKFYYRNKILEQIETYGVNRSHFILLQGLTKLRQIANHPRMIDKEYQGDSGKLEDVTLMLTNAISEGHKILVFSQFVRHLNIFCDYLNNMDISYAYLDGSTKDRQSQVESFQENDAVKVFLISLKAGGLGLNLTKADYVFILDPWWNPAVEQQAIDRAHRIGQENKVFTYKFITKNTVEEKILALQQRKVKLAKDLITTEESFFKELSTDDIKSLLE